LKLSSVRSQAGTQMASPASNGGRGLKHIGTPGLHVGTQGIARQQWRAWIETPGCSEASTCWRGIARQQWRAWIETVYLPPLAYSLVGGHRPPAMAGVD